MLQESFPITSKHILWSCSHTVILGAFDIKYMSHTSIRGQVLADLVAEFAECPKEIDGENHNMSERSIGMVFV